MDNQNSYFSGNTSNQTPNGPNFNQSIQNNNPGYISNGTYPQATSSAYTPTPSNSSTSKTINKNSSILATIILVVVSLSALTFLGLFIYMFVQWNDLKQNSDTQTAKAVEEAVYQKTVSMENEFAEKEKYPFKTFAGPVDYGALTFEHPRTWSVYISKDASSGGEYEAYLNVDKVNPINYNAINSLRVVIKDQSFDQVARNYESNIKNGKLKLSVTNINGQSANTYKGELPSGQITGIATLIKIRDKTIIIQTDALIFEKDYNEILKSIKYNL